MIAILKRLQESGERRLVDAFLAKRDEKAFHRLYQRHTPPLYQLVLRLLAGDEHDTQEVIQDTWVRAVKRLGHFRWQSSFRTWLTGIAINRCREQFRRRTKRNEHSRIDDLELANPAESGVHLRLIDLENAIAKLPEGYRQVLVLHDIEGYKHAEIGQLLDIDPGTSKSQLFNARRALRRTLYANDDTSGS